MSTRLLTTLQDLQQAMHAYKERAAMQPAPVAPLGGVGVICDGELARMHYQVHERISKNQKSGEDLCLEQSALWFLAGQIEEEARMYTTARESYELAAVGADMIIRNQLATDTKDEALVEIRDAASAAAQRLDREGR